MNWTLYQASRTTNLATQQVWRDRIWWVWINLLNFLKDLRERCREWVEIRKKAGHSQKQWVLWWLKEGRIWLEDELELLEVWRRAHVNGSKEVVIHGKVFFFFFWVPFLLVDYLLFGILLVVTVAWARESCKFYKHTGRRWKNGGERGTWKEGKWKRWLNW